MKKRLTVPEQFGGHEQAWNPWPQEYWFWRPRSGLSVNAHIVLHYVCYRYAAHGARPVPLAYKECIAAHTRLGKSTAVRAIKELQDAHLLLVEVRHDGTRKRNLPNLYDPTPFFARMAARNTSKLKKEPKGKAKARTGFATVKLDDAPLPEELAEVVPLPSRHLVYEEPVLDRETREIKKLSDDYMMGLKLRRIAKERGYID